MASPLPLALTKTPIFNVDNGFVLSHDQQRLADGLANFDARVRAGGFGQREATTAATPTTRCARATTCLARSTRAARRTTTRRIRTIPESTTPKNFTGGLYASDLFLKYYIPLIEQSQAFKQGGLIDVTFDEAFPPFTYTGNSFNDANNYPPTKQDKPNAAESIKTDTAGENLFGQQRALRADRPELDAGQEQQGRRAVPGPG